VLIQRIANDLQQRRFDAVSRVIELWQNNLGDQGVSMLIPTCWSGATAASRAWAWVRRARRIWCVKMSGMVRWNSASAEK
jgi:hypothetical protein